MIRLNKTIIYVFLIFVLAFMAGLPTLSYDFFGDDTILILENPDVQSIEYIPDLYQKDFFERPLVGLPTKSLIGYYRPFTKTTFALDWLVWKRYPAGFHLSNTLVHVGVCISIFFLAMALGTSSSVAFLSSALFAVFPTHDQALGIINARSDLLCVLGLLLACLGFVRKKTALLVIGCLIAPFSKEQGIFVLPLVLTIMLAQRKKISEYKKELMICVGVILFYFLMRIMAIDSNSSATLGKSIFQQKHFILIGKLFEILGLSTLGLNTMNIKLLLIPKTIDVGVLFGWLLFVLSCVFAVLSFRRDRKFILPLAWVLLGCAPMLMAHRLSMPLGDVMIPIMDRWAYLPSVGVVLALAAGFHESIMKRKSFALISLAVGLVLFLTLWMRLPTYKNDKNFNLQTLRIYQQLPYEKLPTKLAVRRLDMEGILLAEKKKFNEALDHLNKAHDMDPNDVLVQANLGVVYAQVENYEKAAFFMKQSLEPRKIFQEGDQIRYLVEDDHARNRPQRYSSLGEIYRRTGKIKESEEAMRNAVEGDPTNLVYLNNLAGVIAMQGRLPEAKFFYMKILDLQPCYMPAIESLIYILSKTRDPQLKIYIEKNAQGCPS